MLIDQYFSQVDYWITDSPLVHQYQIEKDKRSLYIGYVSGYVQFTDGSELHIMEFIDTRHAEKRYKYAYHYQDAENKPLFRYDMAPHHMHLSASPHHKHLFSGENESVIESSAPLLSDVLLEVQSQINSKQ